MMDPRITQVLGTDFSLVLQEEEQELDGEEASQAGPEEEKTVSGTRLPGCPTLPQEARIIAFGCGGWALRGPLDSPDEDSSGRKKGSGWWGEVRRRTEKLGLMQPGEH